MDGQVREELLLALNGAVADRRPWARFLDLCLDRLHLSYANLIFRRGPSRSVDAEFFAGDSVTQTLKFSYRERFASVDPVLYFAMEPGRSHRLADMLRTPQVTDHPFYREFLKPAGIAHMLSARIVETGGETAWLTFCRRAEQGDFTAGEQQLFDSLLPHIEVALRTFVLIDRHRVGATIARHVSMRFDTAAIALTANGKLVGVGPLASSIVAQSSIMAIRQNGHLRLHDPALQRRLSDAIAIVLSSGRSRALLLGTEEERIELLVAPFLSREGYGTARPDIVVYLRRDRMSGGNEDVRQNLAAMFGLTVTEADIAMGLAAGRTMTNVAHDLGLSEHTVRSYSKAIYAKLGVRRQVDLVRLLLLSVAQLACPPNVGCAASGDCRNMNPPHKERQIVAYKVEALSEGLGFGRQIIGLSPTGIEKDDVRRELCEYWLNDGLLLFRGSEVTAEFQIELSRVFGALEVHPVRELVTEGTPELITLVSDQNKEGLFEVDGKESIAFLPWHSDLVFTDSINHGGVLTAKQISSWGGQTGFIDQVQAYDLLPDDLKAQADGLEIVYQLTINPGYSRYGTKSKVRTIRMSDFEKSVGPRLDTDFPPVVHPVVFTQPDTGRKVLNISPFGALNILGQDDEKGHALLQRLVDHLVSCPSYYHSWQPFEMLLWDNWRMVHCVTGAAPDEVRIMQRTTIRGDYGLGRKLGQEAAAA